MLGKIIVACFLSATPALAEEPLKPVPTIEQRIELRAEAYKMSPELVQVAIRIAKCESGLKQFDENGEVLRGKQNSQDVGVFQINEKYHLEASKKMGFNIYAEQGNIDYAMWLMKKDGTKPWNWSRDNCWGKTL